MSPLRPPEAAGKGGAARTAHARTPLPALRPLRSPPALPRSWTLPLHSLCIWNVPLHAQGGQSPLSPFLFPLFSLSSLTPRSSRGLINLLKKARFSLTAFQRRNVRGIFFLIHPPPALQPRVVRSAPTMPRARSAALLLPRGGRAERCGAGGLSAAGECCPFGYLLGSEGSPCGPFVPRCLRGRRGCWC